MEVSTVTQYIRPEGYATQRLQKILSLCGVASRRESEKLIKSGRVTVNGAIARIGQSAILGIDLIELDGTALKLPGNRVYIMLNKPKGFVSTMKDDKGRNSVIQLVEDCSVRVYPVGRLDMDSEGLLLLTNDGDFANRVMHPKYNNKKTYHVNVIGDATEGAQLLKKPIELDNKLIKAIDVKLLRTHPGGGELAITIGEGINREVRRMCDACRLRVVSLRRVSIGDLSLGSLAPGKWRDLTVSEIGLFTVKR